MFGKEMVVTVSSSDGSVETRSVVVDEKVGGGQGGDLLTLWAFSLICCVFAVVPSASTVSFSFVDLTGASSTHNCVFSGSSDFFGSGCGDSAPYIGFGSSSASPSSIDTSLVGELASVSGSRYADESAFTCSVVGSWTPDSGVTVCEVGLYMLVCADDSVASYVLFDSSVLSPCVSVGAGETISVAYVFSF